MYIHVESGQIYIITISLIPTNFALQEDKQIWSLFNIYSIYITNYSEMSDS